ncbi:MAG TPA: GNAT family N-acetyltransferase [Solimonas sp.]|nr:GNAT family N-acetyltransferase [Solimonas sp.]
MSLDWRWYSWPELPPDVLYSFLKLRSDIFVVEQNCVFSEMDGVDERCEHLCGFDANDKLLAYLRLVPPAIKAPPPSLGRLVVDPSARAGGVARQAMRLGIEECSARYPGQGIYLSGQQYLEKFYGSLGFRPISPVYVEDGIPHVNMFRN